jgi:hypothetical protein
VSRQVVHEVDVAGPQCRRQLLFDPAADDGTVNGAVDDQRCREPWKRHEKHGELTTLSDLPDGVFAFPSKKDLPKK